MVTHHIATVHLGYTPYAAWLPASCDIEAASSVTAVSPPTGGVGVSDGVGRLGDTSTGPTGTDIPLPATDSGQSASEAQSTTTTGHSAPSMFMDVKVEPDLYKRIEQVVHDITKGTQVASLPPSGFSHSKTSRLLDFNVKCNLSCFLLLHGLV